MSPRPGRGAHPRPVNDETPPAALAEIAHAALTPRNTEVAELIAAGLTNRQIGERLFLSERTVEWHVDQILNRLSFATRSQVAAWVGRNLSTPLLRPNQRRSTNLPSGLTPLLGRRSDLTALRRLLAANRLVTLVGPGGIGKTRMAVAAAAQVEVAYPDGAWLCDLAPLLRPEMVGDALAHALGITDFAADRLGAAREYLRERRALLVLDNCEHVQQAAGELAQDLLEACPGLRVLATSRAALDVRGEAVWRVLPLALADARRLFTRRASAAAPECDLLDARAADAVAAICERLDNLPLALELAAPALRRLSLDELSTAVLDGEWQRHAAGRQGSLDSVVDWSYRLLTTEEQALFIRLTVFSGWFQAEDASGLVPLRPPVGVLLGQLVEKSMLIAERAADGVVRYRMFHVMQPFARERLAECNGADTARLAHAERMLRLAQALDLNRDEGHRGLGSKLASMVDDLRSALATLLELRPTRAAWLAVALQPFWLDTGRPQEGERWTAAALGANPAPSLERCRLLHMHAYLLFRQGNNEQGEHAFQEALQLADLPECLPVLGDLRLMTALIHTVRGEMPAAKTAQLEAIDAFTTAGSELKAARALNHLALTLLSQNRPQEALELAARSVTIRRRHPVRLQVSVDTLAQAHAILGELDEASALFLEAATLALDEKDVMTARCSLHGLSLISGLRGESERALQLHFCARKLLPEMMGRFDEPLTPYVAKAVQRAEAEVGPDAVARLRAEGESLDAAAALQLVTQRS